VADFTVEGIIDVDATKGISSIKSFRSQLSGLYKDLEKIDQAISKIDGRKIDVDVDVASQELDKLRTDLEAIDDLKATIDLDTTAAQAEAAKLKDELEGISENVNIGFENIDDEVAAMNAELKKIEDATVDIELDGAKALVEAKILREEIDAVLGEVDVDVDVDQQDIDKAKTSLGELKNAIGGGGGGLSGGLIGALILLAATAGPIGGVLAGAVGAMIGPIAVLTTGIASLGIIGIPVFKDVISAIKLMTTDIDSLSPAKLEEFNAALADMKNKHPALWAAAQGFLKLKDAYVEWSNTLRPEIIHGMTTGFSILNTLLGYAGPIANTTAKAFNDLFTKMDEGLKGDNWKTFFGYVNDNIGKFIGWWGGAVGNFITGIANMVVALHPLSTWFSKGLLGMSEDFVEWSANLSENQGFKTFVGFVKDNGPLVGSVIGQMVDAVINLATQLSPLGTKVLENVDNFLKWYNKLSDTNPELATMVAVSGALALALAPVVGWIVKIVAPLAKVVPLISTLGGGGALMLAAGGFLAIGAALAFLNPNTEKYGGMMQTLKDLWDKIVVTGQQIWQIFKDLYAVLQESGAIEDFQEAFTSIFNIMQDLLPILGPIAMILGGALLLAIIGVADAMKYWFGVIEDVIDVLSPVITWIADKFQWLYDKLVGNSIIPDLVNGIIDWFKKLPGKLMEIIGDAKDNVVNKFIAMKDAAIEKVANLITTIVTKVQDFKANITEKFESMKTAVLEKVESLKTNAAEKFENFKETVKTKITNMVTDVMTKLTTFKEEVVTKFQNLKEDAIQKITNLVTETGTKVGEIKGVVTGAFTGAGEWLKQAGRNIIAGLLAGLGEKLDDLKSLAGTIGGILGSVLPGSPVKEGPLKVLNHGYAGKEIVNMIIAGLNSERNNLAQTMNSLIPTPAFAGDGFYEGAGTGAAATGVNNYYDVTATVPVGTNLAEAGREIASALDAFQGSGGRRKK
jgi:predicted  nucleic acid-binding Zn-ribbon protein